MRRPELEELIALHGQFHTVFRIIQLDRRGPSGDIPAPVVTQAANFEHIMKGRTTDPDTMPVS